MCIFMHSLNCMALILMEKKDIYEEYQSLIIEPDFDYESFIEAYGFNYLCIAKNENMYQHVKDNEGYEIVVDTDDYVLAKKL